MEKQPIKRAEEKEEENEWELNPDIKFFTRNCDNCKTETKQSVALYNPDKPEEGEVWVCTVCNENTDWVTT